MSRDQGDRSQVKLHPSATISPEAKLSGPITIGAGCVVHPKSLILAEGGPIVLGENNIVEEQCIIINRPLVHAHGPGSDKAATMTIGSNNHFRVASQIMAQTIGDCNAFEIRSTVSEQTVIGSGCIVGVGASVPPSSYVPDATMVYGPQALRNRIPNAIPVHLAMHKKHLELLQRLFKKPVK